MSKRRERQGCPGIGRWVGKVEPLYDRGCSWSGIPMSTKGSSGFTLAPRPCNRRNLPQSTAIPFFDAAPARAYLPALAWVPAVGREVCTSNLVRMPQLPAVSDGRVKDRITNVLYGMPSPLQPSMQKLRQYGRERHRGSYLAATLLNDTYSTAGKPPPEFFCTRLGLAQEIYKYNSVPL